jgi:hypothetical protein
MVSRRPSSTQENSLKGKPIHSPAVARKCSHHMAIPQQEAAATATQEAAPTVTPQQERRGRTYRHPTAEEKGHTNQPSRGAAPHQQTLQQQTGRRAAASRRDPLIFGEHNGKCMKEEGLIPFYSLG